MKISKSFAGICTVAVVALSMALAPIVAGNAMALTASSTVNGTSPEGDTYQYFNGSAAMAPECKNNLCDGKSSDKCDEILTKTCKDDHHGQEICGTGTNKNGSTYTYFRTCAKGTKSIMPTDEVQ